MLDDQEVTFVDNPPQLAVTCKSNSDLSASELPTSLLLVALKCNFLFINSIQRISFKESPQNLSEKNQSFN